MDKKKGGERGKKINGSKVRKIETKEERRIDTRNCGNKNIFKTGIDRSSKCQIIILAVQHEEVSSKMEREDMLEKRV